MVELQPHYEITLCDKDSAFLANRKFRHVKAFTGPNRRMYCLCQDCSQYLDSEVNNTEPFLHGWCSFMWYLLTNENIHNFYKDAMWRIVPIEWRPWWILSLRRYYPHVYGHITIESPPPAFKDKTLDIKQWDEDIKSFSLARLSSACNRFLQPTIKCPWGCSEFQHKTGNVPFDIMIQRIFQKCSIKMLSNRSKNLHEKVC